MRLLLFFLAAPLFAQTPCADMARQPNVTAAIQTATHFRVSITLRPAADSEIKSEVWLPAGPVWNGKLLMEGGGGLVGSINTEGMTHAVREGYASASTDTGHTGSSGRFALGHPAKITDFAYRAVHETAVAAKALIAVYYGCGPRLSYVQPEDGRDLCPRSVIRRTLTASSRAHPLTIRSTSPPGECVC